MTWVGIPELAKRRGMTRVGMWKLVNRLNAESDGRILRRQSRTGRGGKLEVCLEAFEELMNDRPIGEGALHEAHRRIDGVDDKVTALRREHHRLRRRLERVEQDAKKHAEELKKHAEQLQALKQFSKATESVVKAFATVKAG